MGRFRGHSQDVGRVAKRRRVSQAQTVLLLRPLIDAASSTAPSATRDKAREAVRDLVANSRWDSPYVLKNIGARRCRYLSRLGLDVPAAYTSSDTSRLEQWKDRQG